MMDDYYGNRRKNAFAVPNIQQRAIGINSVGNENGIGLDSYVFGDRVVGILPSANRR
jgi:hypothetical protein